MALEPAITDLEQLKERPEVARLLAWNAATVTGAKFDRNELTIWLDRSSLREACVTLKNDPQLQYNSLSDVTCVDWYPNEPRFEVVYQLFSIPNKQYLRLKVEALGRRCRRRFAGAGLAGCEFLRARSLRPVRRPL